MPGLSGGLRILAVDVGNTSTAFGLWLKGRVSAVRHVDGDVDAVWAGLESSDLLSRVDAIAYASVVPAKDVRFRARFRRTARPVVEVGVESFRKAASACGLGLDYPHPEEIGADRLSDAIGAVARYGAPTLIMDFGTALTAAVVTRDCVWRGGMIAPGLPLVCDYFCERTAKLPRIDLKSARVPKIGRTTEEAMRFGALVGYRGMVREIVAELRRNFTDEFRLVATGGYARHALKGTGLPFVVDPTLTLFGTGRIAATCLLEGEET